MARIPYPIRERNWLGGPVDIKNPKWVHQNLQLVGQAIPQVADAFALEDPFTALGFKEDATTQSIEKWVARPCQVDDSYLISYETFIAPATAFCDFLATNLGLEVRCEYIMPFEIKARYYYANWKRPIRRYDLMGNRVR